MVNQKNVEAGSTRRKNMTAKRKQEAVKRVDRGEPIELVARSLGVTAAEVSRRLKKADYAVAGALKSDGCDGKDLEIKHLQSKVGELTMLIELKDEKIERLEAGRPFVRRRSRR